MKILVSYRGIPQSRGWATGDCVVRAFQILGHDCIPYGTYYQTQERLEGNRKVFEEDWDLYLQMECGDGDPFYLELSNIRSRKRASWWFDAALYPQRWIQQTALISSDMNFIANSNMIDDNFQCMFLPYAADETLHSRKPIQKDRMFGMIGSNRPDRRILADQLGIELKSGIYREEFIYYLASSRYVINDLAGGGTGLIPMRPFEALAAGAVLITPKDDGCSKLGLPCIEYSSQSDLISICNDLKSENILPDYSGQAYILSHHTYKHRCATILQKMFPNERIRYN